MPLASLLDFWKRDPETAPNLVAWRTLPPRPAQTHPFPEDLPVPIQRTLIAAGIHTLYSHQLEAWTSRARRKTSSSPPARPAERLSRVQSAGLCLFAAGPKCPRPVSLPNQSPRTGSTLQSSDPSIQTHILILETSHRQSTTATPLNLPGLHSQERAYRIVQSGHAPYRDLASSHQLERLLHQPAFHCHR